MTDDTTPVAGRAATPPPPNTGQSTLGAVLDLAREPQLQSRRWVHGIVTSRLRAELDAQGIDVFPAVPGLAVESLRLVPARALVVQDEALQTGPWAGTGEEHAPELAEQLEELVSLAAAEAVPVYRVSCAAPAQRPEDAEATEDSDGSEVSEAPEDAEATGIAGALAAAALIAPGTDLFEGTPEGAPASRLVTVLREHAARGPQQDPV